MADRIETSLHRMGQQGAAETSQPAMNATGERSVLAEFADAAQLAAGSLVEEQKRQIADRSGVSRAPCRSLGGTNSSRIWHGVSRHGSCSARSRRVSWCHAFCGRQRIQQVTRLTRRANTCAAT